MHTLRNTIAVVSLLFFSSSCLLEPVGLDGESLTEGACADTTKTFDVSGSAEPFLLLTDLPPGRYRHESAEIYVESKRTFPDGTTGLSRVQFLETPVADASPADYSTSLRCRETSGSFSPYFMQAAIVANLRNYDRARFDISTLAYAVGFGTEFEPKLTVNLSGDVRSANAGTVANTISAYWNSSYRFSRRAGDHYEFHGVRIEGASGRTIYGKSSFTRTNL